MTQTLHRKCAKIINFTSLSGNFQTNASFLITTFLCAYVHLHCFIISNSIYYYHQVFYTSECMTHLRVMVSSFTGIPIYHFLIACLEQNQGNFLSHLTKIAFIGLDPQDPVFERRIL